MPELPLVRRFPALAAVPRASFGTFPTPIERVRLGDGRTLLVKRDDLSGPLIGGNKVRGLEWLLGPLATGRAGRSVLTVGPRGSTHALATATLARRVGATVTVVRWNQEMNRAAHRIDDLMRSAARVVDARWVGLAYAIAGAIRARRHPLWIPAGGATTLALLGHVNAALELSEQLGSMPSEKPREVVVPFGTGGTAAGLALGFRIAGLPLRVVAVRVVPRILGRRRRILRRANAVRTLIERVTGSSVPRVQEDDVRVEHGFYGGAYGRLLEGPPVDPALTSRGIALDDTYSRKAYAAALVRGDPGTLLWLTFDGRLLQNEWPNLDPLARRADATS